MVRIIVIIALLASLFYLVKYIQPVPSPVDQGKVAAASKAKPSVEVEGEEPSAFNPTVPASLPDINNGYVFSEKRRYEKDEPVDAAKLAQVEQGPDPLESLLYSGSIVAGNLRRALVVYQEPSRAAANRRPGRGPAPADQGEADQNKQLNLGEHFLGYVVAAIEPDRIVFEKGGRKVEKFLYDRNKKRMAPPESRPPEVQPGETGGVPLQAIAPPEVLAAMMAPQPSTRRTNQGGRLNRPNTRVNNPPVGAPGVTDAPSQGTEVPSRMVRRSQRLLGIDSSAQRLLGLDSSGISVPVTPVPGQPIPTN